MLDIERLAGGEFVASAPTGHMPRIDTGLSQRPARARLATPGAVVIGVVAATFAAAGAAQAAVPRVGAWESGGRSEPRVSFDVRGPARSRTVQRVSFPITCKGTPTPVGWGSTDVVRVGHRGRFTAYGAGTVIRGRFTAPNRAAVTVHSSAATGCGDLRRYVVLPRGRRIVVRTGRYVSLVGGGAAVGLETTAFGRMVGVEYMDGSVSAGCSDGSQRSLPLAGPEGDILAAPIRPSGRFDISAAGGPSITIAGTFDGGSVAALVDLSVTLPAGPRCTARAQPLVGSLAFPFASSGQFAVFPAPPVTRPAASGGS
jgi:hypothetical protein